MEIKYRNTWHGFKRSGGLMLGISIYYPYPAWINKVKYKLFSFKFHLLVTTISIIFYNKSPRKDLHFQGQ